MVVNKSVEEEVENVVGLERLIVGNAGQPSSYEDKRGIATYSESDNMFSEFSVDKDGLFTGNRIGANDRMNSGQVLVCVERRLSSFSVSLATHAQL